jgi:hypothetical protein
VRMCVYVCVMRACVRACVRAWAPPMTSETVRNIPNDSLHCNPKLHGNPQASARERGTRAGRRQGERNANTTTHHDEGRKQGRGERVGVGGCVSMTAGFECRM